jgi:hypothetical protein
VHAHNDEKSVFASEDMPPTLAFGQPLPHCWLSLISITPKISMAMPFQSMAGTAMHLSGGIYRPEMEVSLIQR